MWIERATNSIYWVLKYIFIGPWLRLWNRPKTSGLEKTPAEGGFLFASNHLAVMDSFFLPLVCKRQLMFLAKKEYFTGKGFVGFVQKWFMLGVHQVPIDRSDKDSQQAALGTALRVLNEGRPIGMYPEGTRSPDGRLYRGKTGLARIALESGVPVFPVAMMNTNRANPPGTWKVYPVRVGVRVGDAIYPQDFQKPEWDEYTAAREMTSVIMESLARLSGQEYVPDFYAADVKKQLAAGEGYPEGAEPGRGLHFN